ncbi:30S ribosomal protein S18 [Salisaeta longa]|uniref:30S ribosomal protein S18 n=1 Tax=Salisaeta longa TaxID=503170 RepID=UPI0003B60F50|nr:30S ribosomal protein S18 [Salisaeta longa]
MADQNDLEYDQIEYIDYKDAEYLEQFVNKQGKILPRRVTGLPARLQRQVTRAIKRARHLALLSFVEDNVR